MKIKSLVWRLCLEFRSGRPARRLNLKFDFIEVLREQFMLPLECSELFPYKDVLTNYKTSLDVGVVETV